MNFLKLLSQEIYASCADQLFGNQKPVQNTGNLNVKSNRWLYRRDLTLWKTVDRCYGYGYYVKDGILMRDGLTGAMPINEPGIILPGTPAAFLACQDLEGVQLLNRPETPLLPEGYKGFSVPEDLIQALLAELK
jgi:hypothetical protein